MPNALLTKEEKKVKVRNYLERLLLESNLEKLSLYNIHKKTDVPLPELYKILEELNNEGVVVDHVAEFEFFVPKKEGFVRYLNNLKKEDKLRPIFQDSLLIFLSIILGLVLSLVTLLVWPDKVLYIFNSKDTTLIQVLIIYSYLLIMAILLMSAIIKSISSWIYKKNVNDLLQYVPGIIIVSLVLGAILSVFFKNWDLTMSLLGLLIPILGIFNKEINEWYHDIRKNRDTSQG